MAIIFSGRKKPKLNKPEQWLCLLRRVLTLQSQGSKWPIVNINSFSCREQQQQSCWFLRVNPRGCPLLDENKYSNIYNFICFCLSSMKTELNEHSFVSKGFDLTNNKSTLPEKTNYLGRAKIFTHVLLWGVLELFIRVQLDLSENLYLKEFGLIRIGNLLVRMSVWWVELAFISHRFYKK